MTVHLVAYKLLGVIYLKVPKKYTYTLLVIVLILCCTTFLTLSYLSYNKIGKMASALAHTSQPTIVLDAGHGGEDGGAASKSGLQEKDINLAVTLNLKNMLISSGFTVVTTRNTDISIGDKSLGTIRERKASDIHNRLKIMEEQDNCIFISIHQNHFSDSKYDGSQIFYSKNNEQSKLLADTIQTQIVHLLQPQNKRKIKPADNTIFLLSHAKVPAIIVECGFLSNDAEAKKLSEPLYQRQMAFSIYSGLLDYLS
jgi:N-acetylmuramoyl-L-alanine amidase